MTATAKYIALQLATLCAAQTLTPTMALHSYLSTSGEAQSGCADAPMQVQIDAALPQLRKHGTMSGLRLVLQTGQVAYRDVRFAGDALIKTKVIARYLRRDMERRSRAGEYDIAPRNYRIQYSYTSAYNGSTAYVFRLKPKRRNPGLLKGELWLNADTGAPLRVWGDFVRSPSIFLRSIHIVQDYQQLGSCAQPLRLLVTVRTRIAGEADLSVWWRAEGR